MGRTTSLRVLRIKLPLCQIPEYVIWKNMRKRCYGKWYPRWGGRGIKVCKKWDSFLNFLLDMGYRPSKKHSLDRRNNNGNYTPRNCRWATKSQQRRNSRNIRKIRLFGKTQLIVDWSREFGVSHQLIRRRIESGWSPKKAITIPPAHNRKRP